MAGTGQAQIAPTKRKQFTSASSADATTFAPPNQADWVQIIGAGSTILVDESGASVTLTTDAAEPVLCLPGPWQAFTSTTATRVRMGSGGPPPAVQIPPTSVLDYVTGTALTDTAIDVPTEGVQEGIPVTYVPARNTIFLSFALLSSTGIGDVIPVRPLARGLASLEMLVGVMYLAVVVSRLVGLTLLRR